MFRDVWERWVTLGARDAIDEFWISKLCHVLRALDCHTFLPRTFIAIHTRNKRQLITELIPQTMGFRAPGRAPYWRRSRRRERARQQVALQETHASDTVDAAALRLHIAFAVPEPFIRERWNYAFGTQIQKREVCFRWTVVRCYVFFRGNRSR